MAEYIEREAVLEIINRVSDRMLSVSLGRKVVNLPAADVAPVVHGEWVSRFAKHWKGKDECGKCGFHERDHRDLSHYNFCPNCGADMRERKGDEK